MTHRGSAKRRPCMAIWPAGRGVAVRPDLSSWQNERTVDRAVSSHVRPRGHGYVLFHFIRDRPLAESVICARTEGSNWRGKSRWSRLPTRAPSPPSAVRVSHDMIHEWHHKSVGRAGETVLCNASAVRENLDQL